MKRFFRRFKDLFTIARGTGRWRDWALGGALGLAATALYLAARGVFYNFDALGAAEAVETAPFVNLFHPHHLLYSPVCRIGLSLARLFGFEGRALGPMHVVSAAAGGVGVTYLFLLCRTLGARRPASLWAGLALATAYGYWWNAATVENAALGAASAIVALYATARVPTGNVKSGALAGAALALSALCHQINFLLGPGAILYVLTSAAPRKRKALALLAAYAGVTLLGYVALPAVLLHFSSPSAHRDWFFYYARSGRWGDFAWRNVLSAADGFARAFYVNSFGDNVIAPFVKGDARHLRVALPLWLAVATLGANLTWWLARARPRHGLRLLGPTFVAYAVFVFWWEPEHVDFWLVPTACVLGSVALAVSELGPRWSRLSLAVLAFAWAGIANVNWRDGVKPRLHLEANPNYRAAIALSRLVPREALCYAAASDALMNARYFGGLKRARTPNWAVNRYGGDSEKAARRIEKLMRREWDSGRPVYVGDRAFPGIGGPPLRTLGERVIRQGRAVGFYAGNGVRETIYAVPPGASVFNIL